MKYALPCIPPRQELIWVFPTILLPPSEPTKTYRIQLTPAISIEFTIFINQDSKVTKI